MSRDAILLAAVSAGPVVWILYFGAIFSLSGWTCAWQSKLVLYVLSAIALILTCTGIVVSWTQWRNLGKEWPGEDGGPAARAKAVAIFGIGLNAMFLVVVVAQTLPQLLLMGCE